MPITLPAAEIRARTDQLQETLAQRGISLALIRQHADLFYYTGTVADQTSVA